MKFSAGVLDNVEGQTQSDASMETPRLLTDLSKGSIFVVCAPLFLGGNIGSEIRPRGCVILSDIRNCQKYLDPLNTATAFLGTHAGYLLSVLTRGIGACYIILHPGISRGGHYNSRADEGQTGVPALRDTIYQVSCMQLAGRRPSAARRRWRLYRPLLSSWNTSQHGKDKRQTNPRTHPGGRQLISHQVPGSDWCNGVFMFIMMPSFFTRFGHSGERLCISLKIGPDYIYFVGAEVHTPMAVRCMSRKQKAQELRTAKYSG